MDLCEDIFNMVRVTRDNHSGTYSIQMPSNREVARLYHAQGVKAAIPDEDDPFWKELFDRVVSSFSALAHYADVNSSYGRECTASSTPQPGRTHVPKVPQTAVGDEAKVRGMSGVQALATLSALKLKVPPHPTNPGITSMRAKNALYAAIRRGVKLPGG